jgi:hypothetical protein
VSWTNEDGEHEGWPAAEFPDGRFRVGSTAGAALVQVIEPGREASGGEYPPDEVDGRTAIGWRGICSCGWRGPLWRRAPSEAAAGPARRLVYWADANEYADPPEGIEDAIGDEWRVHLPSPAIGDVKAAAAAARKADAALDDAVRLARLDGATWAAIGAAAAMTRQAANERWGKRWQPVTSDRRRHP